MDTSTIIGIVVGVLVVLALVAVAVKMSGKQKEDRRRAKADDIRQGAAENERDVQRHQAEAAEQEAQARQARADADQKAAAAEKLELDAQDRAEQAAGKQNEQRDRLRAADELDPDVPDQRRDDADTGLDSSQRPDGIQDGAHRRVDDVLDHPRDGTAPRTPPSRPGE